MKSRSFPKLDRPPRCRRRCNDDPSRIKIRDTVVTKQTWIEWRMNLGAGRNEALKLWHDFREWADQEAKNPRARVLVVGPWQDWEREFKAFLDEMPRKPYRFLAMIAAAEKRREVLQRVADKKAIRRRRYQRAHHQ